MNYKAIIGILLCLLLIGGAQAAVTHFVQHSGAYTIEIYNGTGGSTTWTPPHGVSQVEYLVVGGGGGGGADAGGGGGAGGLRTGILSTTPGTGVTVTVGAGGTGSTAWNVQATKGGTSSLGVTISATGGGIGGIRSPNHAGGTGGSGGGSNGNDPGAAGGAGNQGSYSPVEGYDGGVGAANDGAGGGGATAVGDVGHASTHGGNGGHGYDASAFGITANSGHVAGGGAGGASTAGVVGGTGGTGGGGNGGFGSTTAPTAGATSTGSGGGGGGSSTYEAGANGGSGIVIIKYLTPRVGTRAIVTFKDVGSATWTPPTGVTSVRALVVGGGGSGGSTYGGGGGAGGMKDEATVDVSTGSPFTITVGAGGATVSTAVGNDGGASSFGSLVTVSGGGGGGYGSDGRSGGSGGGGSSSGKVGGSGTSGQGTSGGNGVGASGSGGGGGKTTGGSNSPADNYGGDGGTGATSNISGELLTYAAGGGAGGYSGEGAGTSGVSGSGSHYGSVAATSGTNGRGGGGGGGSAGGYTASGAGGSGIVIISYVAPESSVSGDTVEVWNIPGTYSWAPPSGISSVNYLVVAGGGGGGSNYGTGNGGGGGAGGYRTNYGSSALTIDNGAKTITVGDGGAPAPATNGVAGYSGGDSSIENYSTTDDIISTGGGGGGQYQNGAGANGGSGGGGGQTTGAGGDSDYLSPKQGYDGGTNSGTAGSGGGGAGAVGGSSSTTLGGVGGDGLQNAITGTNTYYAGGGAGYTNTGSSATLPSGGLGGGGSGGGGTGAVAPGSGTRGLGGGGAGGGTSTLGASGGSGIVIIRYSGSPPANIPIANFTSNVTGGQASLPVYFTDTSTNRPKVWNWSINASDWSSRAWYNYTTSTNLAHTFTTAGIYNVTLSVQNITESATISTKQMDIRVNSTLQADFVGTPTSGLASTDVSFVDFSTGDSLYSWSWNFGDGATSVVRNPTHTYSTVGTFDVSLTVMGSDGSSSKTNVGYITMGLAPNPDPASTLSFRQNGNIIKNLTYYNRTVQISNVVNGSWINGTTLFDTDHIRIQRILANTTTFKSNTINSYSINNVTGTIMFNATNTSGFVAGTTPLSFMDIEMLYDRYATPNSMTAGWGSGSIGNSTYKVMHPIVNMVDTPLTYSWTTYSDFVIVNSTPAPMVQPATFTPTFNNMTTDMYSWSFGDGSSNVTNASVAVSHTYTTLGVKTITLTAYRSENSSVTNSTSHDITVTAIDSSLYASFTATPTSGAPPFNVKFFDTSIIGNTTGLSYLWDFGDGTTSTTIGDTSHVYTYYGNFDVKLKVNNTQLTGSASNTATVVEAVKSSPNPNPLYITPHNVKVIVKSAYGGPIEGVDVTATYVETSGPFEWLYNWLGIQTNTTTKVADTMLSAHTGKDGSVNFLMVESVMYNVTAYKIGAIDRKMDIYPKDDEYTIWIQDVNASLLYDSGYNQLEQVKIDVSAEEINKTAANFTIGYTDYLGKTNSVQVFVNRSHSYGNFTNETVEASYLFIPALGGTSNFSVDLTVMNHRDKGYIIHVSPDHQTFGNFTRDFGHSFPPGPISLGMPENLLVYIGMGMLFFIVLGFTKATGPGPAALITMFAAWIMYLMRWWIEMAPEIIVVGALSGFTALAILYNVVIRSKKYNFD